MTESWAWVVEYRAGGWARARESDGLTVYLRLAAVGGTPRLRACMATVMSAGKPITEAMWRSVPIADIEANLAAISGLSGHPHFDRFNEAMRQSPGEIDGFSVDALERFFDETEPEPVTNVIPGGATVNGKPLRDQFKLVRPADGRLTDDFLRSAAGIYVAAIGEKKAPAVAVANAAGVPVRTVHGWVAEARRRGILPPATKGKAG